jgi:hypothetical protein
MKRSIGENFALIKKGNEIFLIHKEIQMGSVEKVIYEKLILIHEDAVSHI